MANEVKWSSPAPCVEEARNSQREGRSAMGKSTVIVTCPFCHAEIEAYKWSLAGAGKRCTCGALHGWRGVSRRWKPKEHRGAMCWCGRDHRFTPEPNRPDGSEETR